MRSPSSALTPLALRRFSLFVMPFALALMAALVRSNATPPEERPAKSQAEALQPARNPERLHLFLDPFRVFGWISGTTNHVGKKVTVTYAGRSHQIAIGKGNTFFWPYKVAKATRIEFAFDGLEQSITVGPPVARPPCVFFIVDRSVYRPKQTLRFAGFLRDLNERGEFVPRPARTIEVRLTSEQKKTTAARLKLTADAQGRIVGQYTFSDADPLDSYRLAIPDYKGEARVRLAEYRKTKVHLNVLGKREGSRLRLRFQARDYLDKPVTNSRVQFLAQVVREPVRPAAGALDGKQFAYAGDNQPPVLRPQDLTIEERALAEADSHYEAIGGLNVGRERKVVAQIRGNLLLDTRGEGVSVIELRKSWLQDGHTVVVRGVLIDGNGREERRTTTIALKETDDTLQLSLPQSTFRANEVIRVTARDSRSAKLSGAGTLAVMRLSPPVAGMMGMGGVPAGFSGGMSGFGPRPGTMSGGMGGMMGLQPIVMSDWSAIRRELATAIIFKGDTAALRLPKPGAYLLTAIWHKRDGSRLQQRIGCTVLPDNDLPPLRLHLDRDSYQSGETLTGSIRSKYSNACVLLTLRDSVGLRMWQTIQLAEGKADIKLPLPAQIHYGCSVEVQYADDEEPPYVASRIVHIVPARRMLTIHSDIKPIVEPGTKAVLDLQVNRQEPVDLIVSVYDKALLNIAPDQSTDIRDFYLADDRIYQDHAREILRRRLDDMTLREMLKQARDWLKEHADQRMTAEGMALQTLVRNAEAQYLRTTDVAVLLRLAGVKTRAIDAMHPWPLPKLGRQRRLTLWQWLNTVSPDGWRFHYALAGDITFITAYHSTQNPAPWNAVARVYYPYSYWMNRGGMIGMGGMGMMGIAGVGGIAGFGGGGFNQAPHFQSRTPERRKPRFAALDVDNTAFSLPIRRDFADCAYWNAQLRTDADGKAHVELKLPDSLTSWQVVVTAISRDMHVGRHETSFRTARPLMVTPILPRFFTEGDKARVAANIANGTETPRTVLVHLAARNGKVVAPLEKEIHLEPQGRATVSWDFQAGDAGDAEFLFRATSKTASDASLKKLPVVRAGVEHVVTASGFCKDAATIKLPDGVDPSRVVLEVRFAPTLTADLLDTLPYLVDYPYGCVEQTMSRFLPAIKVAQILKKLHLDNVELKRKLPGCVDAGIKRLLEFQHADGGWGWWTNDSTHPFMTPYALYGLIEADNVGYVIGRDDAIPRGLKRLEQFIDRIGANRVADRIYCMYVYGQRLPLRDSWWDFIEGRRGNGRLSDYALALSLELAAKHQRPRLATALADDLHRRAQKNNGQIHWRTAGFSRWADDPHEVTAAVLKAMVAFDPNDRLIPGVLAYFVATKRDNRWNSTKDTALIVYALCDYLDVQQIDPHVRPSVAFRCNDGPEQKVPFALPAESRKTIVPAKQVRAGVNRLTFTEATPGMMYRLVVRYWVYGRNVAAESNGIEVRRRWWLLDDKGKRGRELKSGDVVPRGAYLESTIEAQPSEGDGTMRFVNVENPRPASCEVVPQDDARFEQQGSPCLLREDRDRVIAFHHDQTSGKIIDRCVLHAELPGDYLVCPARVEMMYKTEMCGHSGTFAFRVADK